MKNFFLLFILLSTVSILFSAPYNYADALEKGIWFYDANKCGTDVDDDNVFSSWRSACHVNDGSTVGVDLTGGYHDAGDHVKFGLPQYWTATILGWSLYEYRSTFDQAGITPKMLNTLKYFTDYILKSHTSPTTFYYQVGDGNADHGYWGAPELQTGTRPVLVANPSSPASDICAEASAALALMYLNYRSTNNSYAQTCLNAAIEIYDLARNYLGRGSDGSGGNFYSSSSHFDDLSWGGIWLYVATGDSDYLSPIDGWLDIPNDYGDDNYDKPWAPAWDDVTVFVLLKMAEFTGVEKYRQGLINNLEFYRDDLQRTPYGLPWLDSWGVLRYASSEAGLGYLAYKNLGYGGFKETADLSMNYILGDNPRRSSYITGWGSNPPVHPHHRANEPNRDGVTNGMIGALVGGPDNGDGYRDDVNDYTMNEVAIDYNASFILGMAGMTYFYNGGAPAPTPTPLPTPTTPVFYPTGDGDGLAGSYYTGTNFGSLAMTRVDPEIDFNWGGGSPDASINSDGFSVRWTGKIETTHSSEYTFTVNMDDGAQLWIDKQLVASDWTDHAARDITGNIFLEGGQQYDITLEYYESSGDASVQLYWSTFWMENEIIPQSQLYSGSVVVTPSPTTAVTPAATPTGSIVITPTPTAINTPTPTSTPSPTPTIPVNGDILVDYNVLNDWGSGATINITITNQSGSIINGWELEFNFPGNQKISNLWGGSYTQNGQSVSISAISWNQMIANGSSITLGFNMNYSGTNSVPSQFTVN